MNGIVPRPKRLCRNCGKMRTMSPKAFCCGVCAKFIQPASEETALVRDCLPPTNQHTIAVNKDVSHLRKYGLTPDDHAAMLKAQNGRCAICGVLPGPGDYLVVDHCHYSGTVRELLCRKCNTLLGFANDSFTRLESAIKYLEKHLS